MMIWIVSFDKAGIRNPLHRRLVLCAFEEGELLILSSDYHNPAEKNSVFFCVSHDFFCTFARSILSAYAVCVTFASISLERIFRMFRRNSVEAIATEIRSATGSA